MKRKNEKSIPSLATEPPQARISEKSGSKSARLFLVLHEFEDTMTPRPYKEATLKKGKVWLISWYEYSEETKKLERFRHTCNLNRITDLKKREIEGWRYCTRINAALASGWRWSNQSATPTLVSGSQQATQSRFKTAIEALNWALDAHCKKLKKRSKQTYESAMKVFADWLSESRRTRIKLSELDYFVVTAYINHRLDKGIAARTINNQIGFLYTVFEYLVKGKEARENIFKIDALPEQESEAFEALTPQELTAIAEHIKPKHPDYYLYLQFIYWQSVRPYHIGGLKSKHVNYDNNILTNPSEAAKNRKRQQQQLMDRMKERLIESGRHKLDPEMFLFGKDFKPSQSQYESLSTRAGELWKQLVQAPKANGGLGINKKMYALKHTFNQLYIEQENVDTRWLQQHNKHSSLEETEKYLSKKRVKKIDASALNVPLF